MSVLITSREMFDVIRLLMLLISLLMVAIEVYNHTYALDTPKSVKPKIHKTSVKISEILNS